MFLKRIKENIPELIINKFERDEQHSEIYILYIRVPM